MSAIVLLICNLAWWAVDVDMCYATKLPIDSKSKSYLKKHMKLERAINRIRRYQRRLGFQSDAHAEKGYNYALLSLLEYRLVFDNGSL